MYKSQCSEEKDGSSYTWSTHPEGANVQDSSCLHLQHHPTCTVSQPAESRREVTECMYEITWPWASSSNSYIHNTMSCRSLQDMLSLYSSQLQMMYHSIMSQSVDVLNSCPVPLHIRHTQLLHVIGGYIAIQILHVQRCIYAKCTNLLLHGFHMCTGSTVMVFIDTCVSATSTYMYTSMECEMVSFESETARFHSWRPDTMF